MSFQILLLLLVPVVVFAIYDVIAKDRQSKVMWVFAMILIPITSLLYLILSLIVFRKKSDLDTTIQSYDSTPPIQGANEPDTNSIYQDPSNLNINNAHKLSTEKKVFKVLGIVLGIIGITLGLVTIGLIIFLMLVGNSYGSNK